MESSQSKIADRFTPFGTTIFSEMTALANKHQAVNLSQGFPDFDGPELGKSSTINAINSGQNQYAPMHGIPSLRNAISAWANHVSGIACDPDTEITVTSGCTEALAASMLGLLNPGDEVVVFEPYYDSYRACFAMADAQPRFVRLHPPKPEDPSASFSYRPDELRAAFNSRTKAILINTPHNPTGAVFTEDMLQEIADLCIEFDCIAISDEVYERLVYEDHTHRSIATIPIMKNRTIVLSSAGKSFSLTGWKIGWAIAPLELTRGIRAAHQFLTFSVPTPLQHGIAALLDQSSDQGESEIQKLLTHYTQTRSLLGEALHDLGFKVHLPQGSYFIMADHTPISSKLNMNTDIEFCKWLPTHAGVAAIPPSAFYTDESPEHSFVRFAFCKQTSTIDQAINRLKLAIKDL